MDRSDFYKRVTCSQFYINGINAVKTKCNRELPLLAGCCPSRFSKLDIFGWPRTRGGQDIHCCAMRLKGSAARMKNGLCNCTVRFFMPDETGSELRRGSNDIAQHVLQNPAVAQVFDFDRRIHAQGDSDVLR